MWYMSSSMVDGCSAIIMRFLRSAGMLQRMTGIMACGLPVNDVLVVTGIALFRSNSGLLS